MVGVSYTLDADRDERLAIRLLRPPLNIVCAGTVSITQHLLGMRREALNNSLSK